MEGVTVTAPGKLILMGEHAAVYGRPALIAAVDLWMHVSIAPRTSTGVALHLPDLDHEEVTDWPSIQDYTNRVRQRWKQYQRQPDAQGFAHMRGTDPAHLVKVALGEVTAFLGAKNLPPIHVEIQSEQPIGAGFGSSAAVAVATVRALRLALNAEADDDTLRDLAMEVERRQHGSPSGIDPATVQHGGLLWAEKHRGALQFTPVAPRSPLLKQFGVYQTGTPNESTGTVVDAVREWGEANAAAFASTLDAMEAATRALRDVLSSDQEQPERTIDLIQTFERGLETLGVVPGPVQTLIRAVEARGGAAKISGAGALSGTGAGSLLAYHPNPEKLRSVLGHLPSYAVSLGVTGIRQEVAA